MTDIVIISFAKSPDLYYMTQRAISSCYYTTKHLKVNIIVIEQGEVEPYELCTTIFAQTEFNYNKFANIGAMIGTGDNIVICNNDVEFISGWLDELLKSGHSFVSPKCPLDARQTGITENTIGDQIGKHLSGWCFLITRKLWEQIGHFSEQVKFWASDDIVIEQCRKFGVLPMLVPSAIVRHIGQQTLKTMPNKNDLTKEQVRKFNGLYGKNRLNLGT